jgi:hypothetical protein
MTAKCSAEDEAKVRTTLTALTVWLARQMGIEPERLLPRVQQNLDQLSPHQLVDSRQAAQILGVAPKTLENWRTLGGGPRYSRLSARKIVYRVADLNRFVAVNKFASTSEYGDKS